MYRRLILNYNTAYRHGQGWASRARACRVRSSSAFAIPRRCTGHEFIHAPPVHESPRGDIVHMVDACNQLHVPVSANYLL